MRASASRGLSRGGVAVAAVVVIVALASLGLGAPLAGAGRDADSDVDLEAYRGLGAWVDVFDYVPAFINQPPPAPVSVATIDDLAALGVRTLYLQAAIDDPRAEGRIVDRGLVGALLRRAHRNGMRVVAWYYPQLVDVGRDRVRMEALLRFRAGDHAFDAVALDIESRQVLDVAERNQRVLRLAEHVRDAAGDVAVGAIVYPAVQLEVVNPALWPGFPYRRLGRLVDVWLPMAYWTFRDGEYRNAHTYSAESVERLRKNLRDPDAPVHPIGGLGEASSSSDYQAFVAAARQMDALGWSVYDVATTSTTAWGWLRGRR